MPHLPQIETKGMSTAAILTALEGITQGTPQKGQMILMLDEQIYNKPQFFPRSAIRNGISEKLLGARAASVVRVPFEPTSTYGAEALSLGAFERSNKVFFRLIEGRPIAQAHWNEIDRYLPFACRSISLPILPVISDSVSGFSFSHAFGRDAWDMIEEEILEKYDYACLVCGSSNEVRAVPRWRFREPIEGTSGPGVQLLDGFMTMCESCHDTFRPSLDSLVSVTSKGAVLKVSPEREGWIRTVNRWDEPKEKQYSNDAYIIAIEAFKRRSRRNWIIDISGQKSVFLQLSDKLYLDHDGWIWPRHGKPFKIVGSAYFESRDCSRNHYKPPSIFDVPWGATLEQVRELVEKDNTSLADDKGLGFEVEDPKVTLEENEDIRIELDGLSQGEVETLQIDPSHRPSDVIQSSEKQLIEAGKVSTDFVFPGQKAFENNESGSSSMGLSIDNDIDDFDDEDDDDDEVTKAPDYN
jgi:hypothetical protein